MSTKITFAFIASTILTIFATGSVLMSLISTGARPISQEASEVAARFSSIFLATTIFLVFLAIVFALLMGSKRSPF